MLDLTCAQQEVVVDCWHLLVRSGCLASADAPAAGLVQLVCRGSQLGSTLHFKSSWLARSDRATVPQLAVPGSLLQPG
jgi:hypothetical protein